MGCGGFLFGYGVADAVYEGEEEGYVDCAGYFGAVCEVEYRQVGDYGFERAVGREYPEFGLVCHCGCWCL